MIQTALLNGTENSKSSKQKISLVKFGVETIQGPSGRWAD